MKTARGSSRSLGDLTVTKTVLGRFAALMLIALPMPALAEDLIFTLTNASSFAVKSFFTSPANVNTWQEDIFGDNYLPAGNQVDVTIADGSDQCVYDFRFILEDDSEFTEGGVDLCALGEYTLNDK